MNTMEFLTQMGALVGLATGIFVLFDRLVRARPRVWIDAEQVGAHGHSVLKVRNLDTAPIFIRGITCTSERYAFARDTSVGGIVRSMTGDRLDMFIDAESERAIQLIDRQKSNENARDDKAKIVVQWRRASSPELKQIPVRLSIRPSRISEIVKAASLTDDE